MKKISVVVPCYNEQEVLPLFYTEIQKVMTEIRQEHPDTDFELLFINDGSRDGTPGAGKSRFQSTVYLVFPEFWKRSRHVRRFGKCIG